MSERTAVYRLRYRKVILGLFWLVTVLPCAFCVFGGAALTRAAHGIQRAYQAVHVWANPGMYPLGKL